MNIVLRSFYLIYQLCIAAPLLLALTLLTAVVTIVGSTVGNAHFWGYYPGRIWSRWCCYLFLLPVRVSCPVEVERNTSYVFVANHQGAFDIFLIYGFLGRNFKWMMKKSLRKMPFIGAACQAAGHIFVDKSGPSKVKETIAHARKVLRRGTSLVVFPEGSRTFTGHMGFFRKGAFQLADELQLSVVPITINGSFNVFPRTAKFVRWHPLELIIHRPVYPRGKGSENLSYLMKTSYKEIEKSLPEEYHGEVENPDQ
ncbi:lysophospholipid acyltransferase family protein [Phocaeicola abscessus]|uniref:lysophospholipid acyltransferase family protein n=1 Tax=Phocaeicola abscessus TaxID=555313 RepID=UPI0028E7605D|nr:lysophospholipid acyltransferase family protein [Phocaeicola abscessus]